MKFLKRTVAAIIAVVIFASLASITAFADEDPTEKTKSPSEYKYAVPEGLPEVDLESWEFRLANTWNSIGLYDAKVSGVFGTGIDTRVAEQMTAFVNDTYAAGHSIQVVGGNSSWLYWTSIVFPEKVNEYGSAREACKHVLACGCDEHQTGLAFDVEGDDDAINYMKEHCTEYGFIYRYPADKAEYYGVACEKPHFRYVGIEAAKYISDNNLCLEEFLHLYGYPVKIGTLD